MRNVIYAMEFAKCQKEGENAGRPRWCSCRQRGLTTAGCLDSDEVSEWKAALRAALVAMRERALAGKKWVTADYLDAALAELDGEGK